MKISVEFCLIPMGVGVSVSEYITACQKALIKMGLQHDLHAYGTNIEGEWDQVMLAIKECHEIVHDMGAPRIFTTLKIGTRTDRLQSLQDKVESVQQKLISNK